MLRTSALLVAMVGSVVIPASAKACSVFVTRDPTPREQLNQASRLIQQATAVIDGEVVRASDGVNKSALVYAYKVLKGSKKEWFEVGESSTCDVALMDVGERLRLILVGGPSTYYLPVDYSNADAEDRILRSNRRMEWPLRPGVSSVPKR